MGSLCLGWIGYKLKWVGCVFAGSVVNESGSVLHWFGLSKFEVGLLCLGWAVVNESGSVVPWLGL